MNQVILKGKSARDVELFKTKSGNSVANVTVAIDRMNAKGDKLQTDWVKAVAFGDLAEKLIEIKKGDTVFVVGNIYTRDITTPEGKKKTEQEIYIDGFNVVYKNQPKTTDSEWAKRGTQFNSTPKVKQEIDFEVEDDDLGIIAIDSDNLPF